MRFAEYTKADINRIIKIPNSLFMEIMALVEPVAVAVHAVKKLSFQWVTRLLWDGED